MTAPRQVLPDCMYLLTRRCTQRQFLLRPDEITTQIFLFCLGVAAKLFDIELIAWCAMSNHWHGIVYDPQGRLPAFLEYFHKLTAKALNARWKRWENLWASEQPSAVRLVEAQDIFDKVVYALANPVADHLVDRVFEWPGAHSLRYMDGRPLRIRRPKVFFRERGRMPDEVVLAVRPPRGCDQESWRERVLAAVREKERQAREARLASGARIVGRRKILDSSVTNRADTREPRRALRPTLACKNKERRIREIGALRQFRAAYASARKRLLAGGVGVLFPAGTYMLRILGIVRCEPSPPSR